MENTHQSMPKLLVIDDKFPVYTRDFINEEIRALTNKFSVSICAQDIVTDLSQLTKLPDWMKQNSMPVFATIPDDLDEYPVIFACWGNLGEKIAQLKHEKKYNGILITRFRGSPEERIGQPDICCYPYLKEYGDLYVPNCDFFKKELCHKFGFDEKKFIVHYESVDVETIKKMVEESEPRLSLENIVSIVSVCRLEPKKGLINALKALDTIRRNPIAPHILYIIIGDGSQKNVLKKQIKELALDDLVIMVGGKSKKEVISMLAQADILLAPSHTSEDGDVEGIMNVLKEAGLAEAIVVATDHAGTPELIQHDITGVLAKQNNAEDLAEKLMYAITQVNYWPEWRSNLKKEVLNRFNGAISHPQLIEIIHNKIRSNIK
jgi:colanic acid/amylovoran biosynthesis glycosyltransferase